MTKVFREESQERPYNNEAYTDTMTAKEQEAYYKSFGQDVPGTPQSIDQAKERLKEAERNQYKNK
jgi:hypothetical protein